MAQEMMSEAEKEAYSRALLRTLSFAGVRFCRFLALDVCNNARCKAVPVPYLQKSATPFHYPDVAVAKVCFAGLPSYSDIIVPETGLDAQTRVVIKPDLSSLRVLPYSPKSATVLGTLHDPDTGELSDLCCRGLLQRIVQHAAETHKIVFNVGVELEFCLYDAETDQPVDRTNFADTVVLDRQEGFISDLYDQLAQQDVEVEQIHAESGNGQLELVLSYETPVKAADSVFFARETIRNVAHAHGLKAIFLPKVDEGGAGNGCHINLSFSNRETGENLFPGPQKSSSKLGSATDISAAGQSFMEGILQHMPALLALTIPTTNSFHRIGPGCWTGSDVSWAFEDKEAPLRVVANLRNHAWSHVEFKLSDLTANLYLALAAILSTGLDGMGKGLKLRPSRHDEDSRTVPLPASLEGSLDSLENDELLQQVIPAAMSRGYVALRRAESERAATMSLEDQVKEALKSA